MSLKYDALVMAVMRGTHREARDLARARFVEMSPEDRGHAEKMNRENNLIERQEAEIARLIAALKIISEGPSRNYGHQDNGGWDFPEGPVSVARNALSGLPADQLY